MAHESIEPTGEARLDIRFAMLCDLVATAMWAQAGGKGKKPSIDDFLIDWWGTNKGKPKQTVEEQRDAILVSLGLGEHLKDFHRDGA